MVLERLEAAMAPKKVSGLPLTAGEEPLTAVILADSFTQVICKASEAFNACSILIHSAKSFMRP